LYYPPIFGGSGAGGIGAGVVGNGLSPADRFVCGQRVALPVFNHPSGIAVPAGLGQRF
jgi:hypothetical protein